MAKQPKYNYGFNEEKWDKYKGLVSKNVNVGEDYVQAVSEQKTMWPDGYEKEEVVKKLKAAKDYFKSIETERNSEREGTNYFRILYENVKNDEHYRNNMDKIRGSRSESNQIKEDDLGNEPSVPKHKSYRDTEERKSDIQNNAPMRTEGEILSDINKELNSDLRDEDKLKALFNEKENLELNNEKALNANDVHPIVPNNAVLCEAPSVNRIQQSEMPPAYSPANPYTPQNNTGQQYHQIGGTPYYYSVAKPLYKTINNLNKKFKERSFYDGEKKFGFVRRYDDDGRVESQINRNNISFTIGNNQFVFNGGENDITVDHTYDPETGMSTRSVKAGGKEIASIASLGDQVISAKFAPETNLNVCTGGNVYHIPNNSELKMDYDIGNQMMSFKANDVDSQEPSLNIGVKDDGRVLSGEALNNESKRVATNKFQSSEAPAPLRIVDSTSGVTNSYSSNSQYRSNEGRMKVNRQIEAQQKAYHAATSQRRNAR